MADIMTLMGVDITTDRVKELMDDPSNNFLKDSTIIAKTKMSFNYINAKIDIAKYKTDNVVDAVLNMAVWQTYMVYVESISEYIKAQTPRIVENRLNSFKMNAILFLDIINVSLDDSKDPALSIAPLRLTKTTGVTGTVNDVKYQN